MKLQHSILPLILYVGMTSSALSLTLFCETTETTGFRGEQGNWRQRNFPDIRYSVTPVSPARYAALKQTRDWPLDCDEQDETIGDLLDMKRWKSACFAIRPVDDEMDLSHVARCDMRFDKGAKVPDWMHCHSPMFSAAIRPNGPFSISDLPAAIFAGHDATDVTLGVGRCDRID